MAQTLDNTLAGSQANSYCDVAFADDYWANHFSSTKSAAWAALKPAQKVQALIQGTRIIETIKFTNDVAISEYFLHYDRITRQVLDLTMSKDPVKYYYYQKLQFPRNRDFDPTTQALYMPIPLMMAESEQAVYLLSFDETALSNRMQGIVNDTIEIGKNQIHLSQQYSANGSMLSPMAVELVRPFFVKSSKQRRA